MSQPRLDTASRILESAKTLFSQKGFDGVSVKEVCEHADVNIAAIHYHFKSKEGLYLALMHQFTSAGHEEMARALQLPKTVEEFKVRLELFISSFVDIALKDPDYTRMVVRDVEIRFELCREVFVGTMMRIRKHFIEFLSHARKQRIIAKDIDPEIAAECIFAQILSQIRLAEPLRKYVHPNIFDPKEKAKWIEGVMRIYLGGVL